MPFHGLASAVVLNGLQQGQLEGSFVGTVQGSVDAGRLLAGHRQTSLGSRWEWADDPWQRFLWSAGDPKEATVEAEKQEDLIRNWLTKGLLHFDLLRPAEHGYEEFKVLADVPAKNPARHPLWHFELYQLKRVQLLFCCVLLFVAGILCSAGGIGGGGIYVTLLMVGGGLSVADAVPLSKAIVFLGSVPSLILNLRKSCGSGVQPLIDFDVCRLVVPSSLIGTFLGVFLNGILPSWILLLLLSLVLVCMTAMVTKTAIEQHQEEEEARAKGRPAALPACAKQPSQESGAAAEGQRHAAPGYQRGKRDHGHSALKLPGIGAAGARGAGGSKPTTEVVVAQAAETAAEDPRAGSSNSSSSSSLAKFDVWISLVQLLIVVTSSVVRYHAGQCKNAIRTADGDRVCHHPFMMIFGHDTLKAWMRNNATAEALMAFSIILPSCVCCLVALYYGISLIRFRSWRSSFVLGNGAMALFTGCIAGLVGIGGGLIFSPFFILMGFDPAVAVATSSTCVLFTSSSTSFQYLLTDRVVVSLALVYGIVNIVASYLGTRCVHFLMDDFGARRSYVSAIVGAGVLVSAVLSLIKLGLAANGVAVSH